MAFDSESHSLMAFGSGSLKHWESLTDLVFDSESDSVYLILHQQ